MDYGKLLGRAWDTVWRYKALWVFGAVLALTSSSGMPTAPHSRARGQGVRWGVGPWRGIGPEILPVIVGVGVAVAIVLISLGIVSGIARYVAETSLIGMIDGYEESGEKLGVRQGLRVGWSRAAWRLFLIELAVGIPTALAIALLLALAGSPALLWLTGREILGGIGTALAVLLLIPSVLLAILVGICLGVLMRFFRRACVLEGLGVGASIRRGYAIARASWGSVATVWLIMVGLGIAWVIARIILLVVLLPLFLLMLVLGLAAGGVPTLIALGVASLASQAAPPWIPYLATGGVGLTVGLPVFILVAGAPWFFFSGLMEVFSSSVWTQAYRELRGGNESIGPTAALAEANDSSPEAPAWEE